MSWKRREAQRRPKRALPTSSWQLFQHPGTPHCPSPRNVVAAAHVRERARHRGERIHRKQTCQSSSQQLGAGLDPRCCPRRRMGGGCSGGSDPRVTGPDRGLTGGPGSGGELQSRGLTEGRPRRRGPQGRHWKTRRASPRAGGKWGGGKTGGQHSLNAAREAPTLPCLPRTPGGPQKAPQPPKGRGEG